MVSPSFPAGAADGPRRRSDGAAGAPGQMRLCRPSHEFSSHAPVRTRPWRKRIRPQEAESAPLSRGVDLPATQPNPKETIMSFRITGLPAEHFAPLFNLSDEELAARGAVRRIAD